MALECVNHNKEVYSNLQNLVSKKFQELSNRIHKDKSLNIEQNQAFYRIANEEREIINVENLVNRSNTSENGSDSSSMLIEQDVTEIQIEHETFKQLNKMQNNLNYNSNQGKEDFRTYFFKKVKLKRNNAQGFENESFQQDKYVPQYMNSKSNIKYVPYEYFIDEDNSIYGKVKL